jgi:tRNA-specific 2-thiouridylase
MAKTRVVVAMSGGVDSSVAAALLVRQGYEVIGIMLRLWADQAGADAATNVNRCCTPEAVADARAIARLLDIPFYDIHAEGIFKQRVVDPWVAAYAEATTPNPCFNCNRSVRFGFLLQKALALGAEYLATGHYARVARKADGRFCLLRGKDEKKDQSYVLHVLGQRELAHAMFPVGDMNTRGEVIGQHEGLPFYTIGQRRGLRLTTRSAQAEPLYVIRLDRANNALIVGSAEELGARRARVRAMHYVPLGRCGAARRSATRRGKPPAGYTQTPTAARPSRSMSRSAT